MAQKILAGVYPIEFYKGTDLIGTADALLSSGMTIGSEVDDIRGGSGHQLRGKYYHTSSFKLTVTNATFDMAYLAMKIGGVIEAGGDVQTSEQVTVTTANQIQLSKTPVAFPTTDKIVAYWKRPTEGADAWKTVNVNPETKIAEVEGLAVNSVVCVKYFHKDLSARTLVIPANVIPQTVTALMRVPQYIAGGDGDITKMSKQSQTGELQVLVPMFQFDASTELSVTSTGHAEISLEGEALAVSGGTCDGKAYYAITTEVTYDADPFDGVKSIAILNSNIELAPSETKQLEVVAIFGGLVAPMYIQAESLTFTSSKEATATVSNKGVVTAVAVGSSDIEVVVTDHPELVATAQVTVAE
jgi:hypothetical protein